MSSSTELKIAATTASDYETGTGNVPTNVLGNNLNTRWSCLGKGSWIQADLGQPFNITEVDIAWYKGDTGRISNFVISDSLDNVTFTDIFTGKSSGTTSQSEKYGVNGVGKYVRVTVNGNNQNDWASITELKVFGSPYVPPPPSSDVDKFGVKMLYPSKPNGESWYYDRNMLVAKRDMRLTCPMSVSDLHLNDDGSSIKVTKSSATENRFYVSTSTGYNHNACSQNWNTNASRGYMQAPNDFRNVEITSLIRINSVYQTSGHSLVWYARSAKHSTSYPAEGSGYKGNIGYNLKSRFQKESGHPYYSYTNWKDLPSPGLAFGKWFGYKVAIYDHNGGVMTENWIDFDLKGNWIKVDYKFDDGKSWGISNPCGSQYQMFLWGAPLVTYRFDMVKDIDFDKMSVREIIPPP